MTKMKQRMRTKKKAKKKTAGRSLWRQIEPPPLMMVNVMDLWFGSVPANQEIKVSGDMQYALEMSGVDLFALEC